MHRIVHLSDLHIGAQQEAEEDHLRRIVDGLIGIGTFAAEADRTLVLITGDLVNDGRGDQMRAARALLAPLVSAGFVLAPIPGNHDLGPMGIHADRRRLERFRRIFYGDEPAVFPMVTPFGDHTLIGLNSMEAEADFWDGLLADGELGTAQRRRLLEILDGLEARPDTHKVILHLHHHPFHYSDEGLLEYTYEWIGHRLKDGAAFMDEIAGRVDALLFGHEHRHLDFSGTALSQRFRIPVILSAGKSTRVSQEYRVTEDGEIDKTEILHEGLLCRVIEVSVDGNITVQTVAF